MLATDNSNGLPRTEKRGSPGSAPSRWLQRLGRSVSAKLMISIFVVMIIIFGLLGYFSIQDQRKHLEDAALISAEQQSEVLRRSASHYMLNNDRSGLYEMMLNMADQPGVVRVRIMNPQGVISYSTAARRRLATPSIREPKPATAATRNRSHWPASTAPTASGCIGLMEAASLALSPPSRTSLRVPTQLAMRIQPASRSWVCSIPICRWPRLTRAWRKRAARCLPRPAWP